jgi:phage baseplate assembly protein W
MDEGELFGRGMAFPPRVGPDGRIAMSAGPDNVRESIEIVLLTNQGERLLLPEFGAGLTRFLFEPNTPATHRLIQSRIEDALRRFEPRIRLNSVSVAADPADPCAALATINYTLVAMARSERVSLRIELEGGGAA